MSQKKTKLPNETVLLNRSYLMNTCAAMGALLVAPLAVANEGVAGGATGQTLGRVSQQGLQAQVNQLEAEVQKAETKLVDIGKCHAANMLYVTRNGTAQCWDPVVTFYQAPAGGGEYVMGASDAGSDGGDAGPGGSTGGSDGGDGGDGGGY